VLTKDEKKKERERRRKTPKRKRPRPVFMRVDPIRLLQAMRKSTKLQQEIAKKARLHQNYLSGYVTGKLNPSKTELSKLCKVLGITQKSIGAVRIEVLK